MFATMASRYGSYSSSSTSVKTGLGTEAGIWLIIAAVLALIGGILVYVLFVKSKNSPDSGFLGTLKKFLNFRIMWIETFVKIAYYIATIFIILASFAVISTSVLSFFTLLLLGPVVIRITYELAMMGIMIWRNTEEIAKNTQKK